MKVVLKDDVFSKENFKDLDKIILRIDTGAHEWDVKDPDTIENSCWYQTIGREYIRELFEKSTMQGIYPPNSKLHTKYLYVTNQTHNTPEFELTPQSAAIYLEKPLTILMENRFSDRLFIETVIEFLGSQELNKFLDNVPDALNFDGGGGNGEIPKVLDEYVESAKKSNHPVRIVAFTDSDKLFPGDKSKDAQKVKEVCSTHDVPCMLLQKRTIENYIPDEVLQAGGNNPTQVAALLRLTPLQRDHFPMKKGFPKTLSKLKPEEIALYSSVPDKDKVIL